MFIDKLDDRINKYSNTYHSTIKMKAVETCWKYINPSKEVIDEDPKFKIGDIIKTLKYKNIIFIIFKNI